MTPRWWLPPVLVALLAAGWWLGSQLRQQPAVSSLAPDPACDLATGSCRRALPGGGEIAFSVSPAPPQVMVPLDLTVSLGRPATRVWVDFAGVNMDMGVNRAELVPGPGGLWQGQTVLPVCTTAEMVWEARVFLVSEDGALAIPHRFTTRP